MDKIHNFFKFLFSFRWKPNLDTGVVVISWVLVTSSLYTATKIVTPAVGGGIPYFLIYAILTALILGIGVPLLWMVIYRKRPIKDLGITRDKLGTSLILQLIFSLVLYFTAFKGLELPAYEVLVPLVALALTIGFFEAVFWRGWVLLAWRNPSVSSLQLSLVRFSMHFTMWDMACRWTRSSSYSGSEYYLLSVSGSPAAFSFYGHYFNRWVNWSP